MPLLTINEAAKVLAISAHTLRLHVRRGAIAHRRIGGRILFTESDVAAFVEASLVPVREATEDQPKRRKPAAYRCQIF